MPFIKKKKKLANILLLNGTAFLIGLSYANWPYISGLFTSESWNAAMTKIGYFMYVVAR